MIEILLYIIFPALIIFLSVIGFIIFIIAAKLLYNKWKYRHFKYKVGDRIRVKNAIPNLRTQTNGEASIFEGKEGVVGSIRNIGGHPYYIPELDTYLHETEIELVWRSTNSESTLKKSLRGKKNGNV